MASTQERHCRWCSIYTLEDCADTTVLAIAGAVADRHEHEPAGGGRKARKTMPAVQLTPELHDEYQRLFETCLTPSSRLPAIDSIVSELKKNRRRYERVGKELGVPWYVIGAIHNMESGIRFDGHLHNGDPLTDRTKQVPAGRPKTGEPPFTWEESAVDALTMQGFDVWNDWSIPGILYKLEEYNGWGYRQHHPDVLSPYLWSFSNHYSRGKYTADGQFSPAAVSAQCGVAALLHRMAETGAINLQIERRVLQLTNPRMVGDEVKIAQKLLTNNTYGDFRPGGVDGEYGPLTAAAVRRAKWALGYPSKLINTGFGPKLKMYLEGAPLPAAYQKEREARLRETISEAARPKRIVQ
jgi:lysozyme family protein